MINPFKKIRGWFRGTKLGLKLRIKELSDNVYNLAKGIEKLEQDLWKERKFKEDYRDRLARYYDECVELRKVAQRYNKLRKRCKKFKDFYGRGCSTHISTTRRGAGMTGFQG
jgi:chromosome segregation ATPase